MSTINLSIRFQHPDAVSHQVSYARIDNVANPIFSNVQPNPTTSPATIATNIPNGQYQVNSIPIYADGRVCQPEIATTPPCPGLISISAIIQSGVLVVSYLAPSSAPKVRITVGFPNGGSNVANYVNDGNNIAIAIPNLTGDFTVSGQSVCDETSNFYSPPSSQVTVNNNPNNLTITSDAAGIVITNLIGIAGFTLPQNINVGDTINGLHTAFFGVVTFSWTRTPAIQLSATISINGTVVQCVNIPNTNGGTISFNSVSVAATDLMEADFITGLCP